MRPALRLAAAIALFGLSAPALARADGTISGTVVDASGHALDDECVSATPSPGVTPLINGLTDADGEYTLEVSAGTYAVEFEGCNEYPNFVAQWYPAERDLQHAQVITVADDQAVPGINAQLETGGEITVQSVDSDSGAPVSGQDLVLTVPGTQESRPSEQFPLIATQADSSGPVSFMGLSTGSYLLGEIAEAGSGRATSWFPDVPDPGHSELIQVVAGQTTTLAQPMTIFRGGAISGTVTGSGRALVGAQVTVHITEPDGSVYDGFSWGTATDGQYTAGDLAPGTWTVTATAGGRARRSGTAVVTENADTPLDLSLPPGRYTRRTRAHRLRLARHGRTLTITGTISDPRTVSGAVKISFGRLLTGRHTLRLGRFTCVQGHLWFRVQLPQHRRLLHPRLFIRFAGHSAYRPRRLERRLPDR